MDDLRGKVAAVLAPQAWAALVTGDTMSYRNRRTSSLRKADRILAIPEIAQALNQRRHPDSMSAQIDAARKAFGKPPLNL